MTDQPWTIRTQTDPAEFVNVLLKGKLYFPALDHYREQNENNIVSVICDKCKRLDLVACIGFFCFDLCLSCANDITKSLASSVSTTSLPDLREMIEAALILLSLSKQSSHPLPKDQGMQSQRADTNADTAATAAMNAGGWDAYIAKAEATVCPDTRAEIIQSVAQVFAADHASRTVDDLFPYEEWKTLIKHIYTDLVLKELEQLNRPQEAKQMEERSD